MRTALLILAPWVFVCGCSRSQMSDNSQASGPVRPPDSTTFADGTVMQVRTRDAGSIEGIHIVRKSPEGLETYDAERGTISEEADGHTVRVILYDARVDLGARGRMSVEQLKMGFIKKPGFAR